MCCLLSSCGGLLSRLYVLQRGFPLGAISGSYSLVVASGFSRVAVEGSSRVVAGDSGHLLLWGCLLSAWRVDGSVREISLLLVLGVPH